jgi:hypothetical protein
MAKVLSGSFNTSAYGGRYLTFSWTATQSIDNNQSTISWTLKGAGGASGYYKAGNFKVVIAGATVYESATRIDLYNGTLVSSGTKVITHNNNGSQSFSASVQAGIYNISVNCSGSGTWELNDIPRKATIASVTNFNNTTTELTININNPLGAKATTAVTIGTDANSSLFEYETFTGNSHKFKLDAGKINALLSVTPKNSREVIIFLRTIVNGNYYWHTVSRTFSVVNGAPTFNSMAYDEGGVSYDVLTKDGTKLISGFNTMVTEINAVALTGATIVKQSVTCGNETKTDNLNHFYNVTSGNFVFSATDSRGNTNSHTITKTVIPYFKPTIELTKNNVTTDGKFYINIHGKFFNGSFGAVNNTITVSYKWNGGEWQTIPATANGNEYTATKTLTGLDYKESYTIETRVIDTIGNYDNKFIAATGVLTVTSIPVFSWNKTKFKHNTHVKFDNHKNIRGTTTDGTEVLVFEPCTSANVTSIGFGLYANNIGATEIWGKQIKFNNKAMGDFVTEQGTRGIWTYRKWNSGLTECWGSVSVSTAINTAWGSMYVGTNKMSRQNYPFTFKTKPKEFATTHSTDGACWIFAESGGTGANTNSASGVYNVCRPTSISTQTVTINLYVVG